MQYSYHQQKKRISAKSGFPMVIHKCNTPTTSRRREFLRNLAFQLVNSHLRQRAQLTCLPKPLLSTIKELTDYEEPIQRVVSVDEQTVPKRGRCGYCDRKKNRPTKYSCTKSKKIMFRTLQLYL
ncbi:hypothetical protein QE152_g37000 [Popillia japonica]|uniref:PiggyBac transposable element-derived protein domain-containing protein n=1 Tax=Popillia japonica TaxID=7064 RepID=A0AAW1IBK5_POPJA